MFQNYSVTYSSQILALAGFVEIVGKQFNWPIASNDVIFVLGIVANVVGIVWAMMHRHSKGDITITGARK